MRDRSLLSGVCLALLGACSKTTDKPIAAATVQNAVTENQLTTVTLTSDAVRRLGIETAPVESASVLPVRTVGGEIMVPPGLSLTVTAPVAGTVLAPDDGGLPTAGMRVTRGSTLLRLAPLPPDAAQAERNQIAAAAQLRQAEAEAERTARLYGERLVSARDNERAQAELATARATSQAAAAQLRMVRSGSADAAGMSTIRVVAPDSGVIRSLHAAPGQVVAAGAAIAEVMRTDRVWVRVPLYAGDAGRIPRTASATVHGLSGPQEGPVIVAVPVVAPPSADASAASVDVFYELRGSSALLRPGQRVGVTLSFVGAGVPERGLSVPLAAVVRDMSGGSWVYVRTDSLTFIRRRIEIARVVGARAMLAIGPRPGTRVVTAGAAELFGTEFGAGK